MSKIRKKEDILLNKNKEVHVHDMQNKINEDSKQPSRYKQKGKEEYLVKRAEEKISELVFILDRSASMSGQEKDTIKGFNYMLKKQKKQSGRANVTTVLFDDASEVLYFRKRIEDVSWMTDKEYFVGGCTALLDAVGRTIHKIIISEKKEKIKRQTDSVIFVIITDGFDNASKEYTYESVKKLIERQKKSGWEFLFLGANMDAVGEAANLGISSDRSVTFHNDSRGVALNYEVVGETVSAMRMAETEMSPIDGSWKVKIEKDYKKER